jgi:hypothetical protein
MPQNMSDCPITWCEYFSTRVLTIKKKFVGLHSYSKLLSIQQKYGNFSAKTKKSLFQRFFMLKVSRIIFFGLIFGEIKFHFFLVLFYRYPVQFIT